MADEITDAELAEIEARAAAATEGPWTAEYSGETGNCVLPPGYESACEYVARTQLYLAVFDAKFIAAARTDVPRLVAALRAAYARLRDYESAICFEVTCTGCAGQMEALAAADAGREGAERLRISRWLSRTDVQNAQVGRDGATTMSWLAGQILLNRIHEEGADHG